MYLNTEAKETGKGVLTGLQKLLWLVCRTRGCCLLMPCQDSWVDKRPQESAWVLGVPSARSPFYWGSVLSAAGGKDLC